MLNPLWLWGDRGLPARMTRFSLLPASVFYRVTMAMRARAYRMRLLPRAGVDVPVVAVGNLNVGGSGKTPISNWIARYYADQGIQPGIVLRGYGGGDEAMVHRRLAQSAIVVENPDRVAGAREAERNGAEVVVLDDAFQRMDINRDLNIALVSTESSRAVPWTLPAGPWREGIKAIRRADLVVVTRKRADRESAERIGRRMERISRRPVVLARLGVTGFTGLLSGEAVPVESLDGARVLAAAGVADPYAFAGQCSEFGARVRLMPLDDHHEFDDVDMNRMVQAGRRVDYVVVTEKDAVKLRSMWPGSAPEPIVASLDVEWESGREELESALDAVISPVGDLLS